VKQYNQNIGRRNIHISNIILRLSQTENKQKNMMEVANESRQTQRGNMTVEQDFISTLQHAFNNIILDVFVLIIRTIFVQNMLYLLLIIMTKILSIQKDTNNGKNTSITIGGKG
jgi:hypothetical protein